LIFFFFLFSRRSKIKYWTILDHHIKIIFPLVKFFLIYPFYFPIFLLIIPSGMGFSNDQTNHHQDRLYSSRGARRLSWIYGHFSGLSPARASCNRDSNSFLSIHAIIDRRRGLALIFLLTPFIALPAYRGLLRLFLPPLGLAPAYLYIGTSTHHHTTLFDLLPSLSISPIRLYYC
jgi:hypothetical protein